MINYGILYLNSRVKMNNFDLDHQLKHWNGEGLLDKIFNRNRKIFSMDLMFLFKMKNNIFIILLQKK